MSNWEEVEILYGNYFHPNKYMVIYKISHNDPKGYEWKFLRNEDGSVRTFDGQAINVKLLSQNKDE